MGWKGSKKDVEKKECRGNRLCVFIL